MGGHPPQRTFSLAAQTIMDVGQCGKGKSLPRENRPRRKQCSMPDNTDTGEQVFRRSRLVSVSDAASCVVAGTLGGYAYLLSSYRESLHSNGTIGMWLNLFGFSYIIGILKILARFDIRIAPSSTGCQYYRSSTRIN